MRFDDSLKTVLSADASTAFGAQAMFRQLADLLARGRVEGDDETFGRLRALQPQVPAAVRAAAARGLALTRPPIGLVEIFTQDEPAIAAAALRGVRLPADDWVSLLPRLGPAGRAILRQRDDLEAPVVRALESFGSTDFALGYNGKPVAPEPPAGAALAPFVTNAEPPAADAPVDAPVDASSPTLELSLPEQAALVAELTEDDAGESDASTDAEISADLELPTAQRSVAPVANRATGGFEIAALVDRLNAYQKVRRERPSIALGPIDSFRFEAGTDGLITWTDAVPRAAIIGASLARADGDGLVQVDGAAIGAFRSRASITDARLSVKGESALAGEWRVSAVPLFDPATGRFTGFRGGARRPRIEESAVHEPAGKRTEGLRRLVHELRTPTNAIAGFSELIEAQLLGPVAPVYRERAATIRSLAADLVAAIEDLDMAARIEGDALELRAGIVSLEPLLASVLKELQPLADARECAVTCAPVDAGLALACDDRAVERLFSRLLATILSAGQAGDVIGIVATGDQGRAQLTISRPRSLLGVSADDLLNLDAEREAELPGAPLLGTGFALRMVRNLARQLGGSLAIEAERFTLVLPLTSSVEIGQASAH